jgi:oligopeptide transport system substrate-binding protein
VPRHAIEAHGEAWIQPKNIVVNGPYKLVYWRTGDQLAADRNPTGFGAENLCFKRVIYFELEDLTAVENKILAGGLDTSIGFDGPRRKELDRKFPGWPRSAPALWTNYWSFNTRIKPFDDIRVRKALAMALDRDFMVSSVLTPGVQPAYAFVPPGMDNYSVERPRVSWADVPVAQRRLEARRLLEEAGFGPKNPLEFEYIHRSTDDNPKVAPVAQDHWSKIAPWVKPTIIKQETASFYQRMRQADFQVGDGAWVADFDDPINYLFLLESETGQQNYAGYANAEYDALLVKAKAETDLIKRAAIFAEAEALMLEDAPITPMWYAVTKNLVNPELTGWIDNAKDVNRSRYLCRNTLADANARGDTP